MSRLIDAEQTKLMLSELLEVAEKEKFTAEDVINHACEWLDNIPTSVTHCKDCKNWADKVAGCTEHVKLCTIGGYMVGENGYCVYAEIGE